MVGNITLHSVQELTKVAEMGPHEQEALHYQLKRAQLLPRISLPDWWAAHAFDVRRVFLKELNTLAASLASGDEREKKLRHQFDSPVNSLTDELERMYPRKYSERKRDVIRALLGLDGGDPLTLEETAQRQQPPMTRERVRQIALPFISRLAADRDRKVWLSMALECVAAQSPCTQSTAESLILSKGIVTSPLRVTALLKFAERAGLAHSLTLDSGLVVHQDFMPVLEEIYSGARKKSSHWGVADWEELRAPLGRHTARLGTSTLLTTPPLRKPSVGGKVVVARNAGVSMYAMAIEESRQSQRVQGQVQTTRQRCQTGRLGASPR